MRFVSFSLGSGLALALPVLAALVLGALGLGTACSRDEPDSLPGVRLGMSPRDVRDRFEPGGEGSWQTSVGAGDDTVLEWSSRDAASRVVQARFEFHLGMLVAVRARLGEAAAERVDVTPRTVTIRKPADEGGTSLTVLARDCPTHREEADAILARPR